MNAGNRDGRLRRLDLNLLWVFHAVMRHRKLTIAAEHLAVTQSAVSHALRRLRHTFKDELFLRTGHGLEPTARALALAPRIAQIIEAVHETLMPDDAFNPAAEAEFRVGMPDHINAIGASLVRTARHDAPGLRISIQNVWGRQAIEALKADKIDLAYTGALLGLSSPEIETELLGTETYVVIVRAGHLLLERPFDLDAYVEAEHVVEGFGGEVHGEVHGIVDAALGKLGRARRIGARLPLFSWVMQTVASSDMIATVGRGWANMEAERHGVVILDPPLELSAFGLFAAWHRRQSRSPVRRWVFECMQRLPENWAARANPVGTRNHA